MLTDSSSVSKWETWQAKQSSFCCYNADPENIRKYATGYARLTHQTPNADGYVYSFYEGEIERNTPRGFGRYIRSDSFLSIGYYDGWEDTAGDNKPLIYFNRYGLAH